MQTMNTDINNFITKIQERGFAINGNNVSNISNIRGIALKQTSQGPCEIVIDMRACMSMFQVALYIRNLQQQQHQMLRTAENKSELINMLSFIDKISVK